ncbi:MAG TPA: hypothetical protein VF461_12170 [Gemmatimonadaceae bacterium]
MSGPISIPRRARHHYAIVLLPLVASCSTLRPVPGVGLAHAEREWIGSARVFLRDGTALELEDATITPDSITGLGGATSTRWAVVRSDVVTVERRRAEPVTPILEGVLAGVAGVFLAVLALSRA